MIDLRSTAVCAAAMAAATLAETPRSMLEHPVVARHADEFTPDGPRAERRALRYFRKKRRVPGRV